MQGQISNRLDWASAQGHQPLTASGGAPHDTGFKNLLRKCFCIIHWKLLKDHTLLVYEYQFHKNNKNNNTTQLHKEAQLEITNKGREERQ